MANDQHTKRDPSTLSRRGFVQGTAVAGLAGLTGGVVPMDPGAVDAGDAGAPDHGGAGVVGSHEDENREMMTVKAYISPLNSITLRVPKPPK